MAVELRTTVGVKLVDGGSVRVDRAKQVIIVPSSSRFTHMVQNVGLVEENLVTPEGASGNVYFWALNRDATNFVQFKLNGSAAYVVKLQPGTSCFFEAEDETIPALADTAAVDVEFVMVEV